MYCKDLHFHFTGIGGSGMSGLAELMVSLGFRVSGSDLYKSAVTSRLERCGVQVSEGHSPGLLPPSVSVLVYSSAVALDNPELLEAGRRGIPVIRRAEVLAELMRLKFGVAVAGSHGKTTTTSMVAQVLGGGGLDPTVIVGGQLHQMGTGAKLGSSQYLVAESDESDRSFLLLRPTIAVVTNIDREHLSAYGSEQGLREAFSTFMQAVPFYGLAVGCVDDPAVRDILDLLPRRSIGYGFDSSAAVRATDISFDKEVTKAQIHLNGQPFGKLELHVPGSHMVSNALAAIAVGVEFGVGAEAILQALCEFRGVGRRMEMVGEVNGITVMNDYGHHPTEVKATIKAIRDGWHGSIERLVVAFQPHRYSRTAECFDEFLTAFEQADHVLMTEVYSAGESPLPGVSGEKLFQSVQCKSKAFCPSMDMLSQSILDGARAGDFILCLGAGSIGSLPERILVELANAEPRSGQAINEHRAATHP